MSVTDCIDIANRRGVRPGVIVDVGARFGHETLALAEAYPDAAVHAIEANRDSSIKLRANTRRAANVHCHRFAAHFETGEANFCIASRRNPGASSLFEPLNEDYPHYIRIRKQRTVPAKRLDDWAVSEGIDRIDLAWMDLQGAELFALIGMGHLLEKCSVIGVELCDKPIYAGQPLRTAVDRFLVSHWFWKMHEERVNEWFSNAVYANGGRQYGTE